MTTRYPAYHGKDTTTLTTELQQYHALAYEFEMLDEIVRLLERDHPAKPPQELENVLTQSFAIHVRNLKEFLWRPRTKSTKGTDVLAVDLIAAEAVWPPPKPARLDDLVNRASREVAHLTTYRLSGLHPDKAWNPRECLEALLPALEAFVKAGDSRKQSVRVPAAVKRLRTLLDDATPKIKRVLDANLSTRTIPPGR
jgi:hypothetical protein